jgi:hypothetical protein
MWAAHRESAQDRSSHAFAVAYEVAAHAFAAWNGWKYSANYCFDVENLHRRTKRRVGGFTCAGWFDHALHFKRWGDNIAIIGQPYPTAMNLLEGARDLIAQGCCIHIPPNPFASLWNPGRCLMLIATHPNNSVHWLPEQEDDHQAEWREREPQNLGWLDDLREIASRSERESAIALGLWPGGAA